jgi:hypothetical protein
MRSGDRRLQRIIDRSSRSGVASLKILLAPLLAGALLLVNAGGTNHFNRIEKRIIGNAGTRISVEEATRLAAGDPPPAPKIAVRADAPPADAALQAMIFAPPAANVSPAAPVAEAPAKQAPVQTAALATRHADIDVLPPVNPFRPRKSEAPYTPRAAKAAPRQVAASQPAEQPKSFFEKLFGDTQKPAGPALAYARPDDESIGGLFSRKAAPNPYHGTQTAVYDIEGRTVILPSGKRLEAHSGLGQYMDDPDNVHRRMKGATPPNTYNLVMREALFHGVRAIRLLPVDNSKMYGRDGILAHTYMLGPRGDSNGCVSIKDYDAFLQAFLRGEIKRIVVVRNSLMLNIAQNAGASRT